MSAYIRNFELIPTIGSFITDIDLGISNVPLSGVINFISLPGLTSFKTKNAAFERFENILGCSGLNVFDVADCWLTLNAVVSCLSAFSDRKAIYPEITGNVKLSGMYMPLLYRIPLEASLDYEFKRLYNFLTSEPYPWNITINPEPEIAYIDINNQTLSFTTTGAQSSYIVVKSDVSNFSFLLNGYDGIYLNNYYNVSALSACFLTLTGTPQVTANTDMLFVGQSATLSAIDGSLHTFYYFNTGSLLLGISPKNIILNSITKDPTITPPLVIPTYPVPSRYGYINGVQNKSFNVNTLNGQTTYVILNTATKLFSLKINDTSVLSGFNWFRPGTGTNTLTSSYISITSVQNLQPSVKNLPYEKTIGLTAAGFKTYDIKYFYTFDSKLVLGIGSQFANIETPSDYYDSYIITAPPIIAVTATPPTTLPPVAYTPPIITTTPTATGTTVTTFPPVLTTTEPPITTTEPPITVTTTPPITTTAPPVTVTTTPPVVTITTTPPATTEPPITITTPPPTTTTPPPTTLPTALNTYVEYELVDTDVNLSPISDDTEIVN